MNANTIHTSAQAPVSAPVQSLPVKNGCHGSSPRPSANLDSHAVWMRAIAVAESMTEKWFDAREYRQLLHRR